MTFSKKRTSLTATAASCPRLRKTWTRSSPRACGPVRSISPRPRLPDRLLVSSEQCYPTAEFSTLVPRWWLPGVFEHARRRAEACGHRQRTRRHLLRGQGRHFDRHYLRPADLSDSFGRGNRSQVTGSMSCGRAVRPTALRSNAGTERSRGQKLWFANSFIADRPSATCLPSVGAAQFEDD